MEIKKRKKVILFVSIVAILILVSVSYIYFRNRKIKADVVVPIATTYYGTVRWSDSTPAKGVVVSAARHQYITKDDGSYYLTISSTDFDSNGVIENDGNRVKFYDPKSLVEYDLAGQINPIELEMPRSSDPSTSLTDFVLQKPAPILANNFAVIGTPAVVNKSVTFRFSFVNPTNVTIKITGRSGQTVKTVTQAFAVGGNGEVVWNGTDSSSRPVAAGVYNVQITGNDNLNPATALPTGTVTLK